MPRFTRRKAKENNETAHICQLPGRLLSDAARFPREWSEGDCPTSHQAVPPGHASPISHKGCGLSPFENLATRPRCHPSREKAPTTDDRETWFKKGRGRADADPNSIAEVWNSGGGNDLTVMDENGTEERDDDAEKELLCYFLPTGDR